MTNETIKNPAKNTTEMRHEIVNMEWTQYSPEAFQNLNNEQCEALANFFTVRSRRSAEHDYAARTYESVIEKLTELDSIDATKKALGRDYIADSLN